MLGLDKKEILEILLKDGKIDADQMKEVLKVQHETKQDIEDILITNGFVQQKDVLEVKAKLISVDFFDLTDFQIFDVKLPFMVTENIARRYCLIPVEKDDFTLTVAMKDPTDIFAIDDLRLATAMEINPVLSQPDEILKQLNKYFIKEEKPFRAPEIEEVVVPTMEETFQEVAPISDIADYHVIDEYDSMQNDMSKPGDSIFKERIGDMLVRSNVLTKEQLEEGLEAQRKTGDRLGEVLVQKGFINRSTLYQFLEQQYGVPHVNLDEINIEDDVVKMVSEPIARRYALVPVAKEGYSLKVAMSDPLNIFSIDDLRLATGMEIIPMLADAEQVKAKLDKHYETIKETNKVIEEKQKLFDYEEEIRKVNEAIAVEVSEGEEEEDTVNISDIDNAPIVKMVNMLFGKAISSRASDIHIEPYEDCVLVRCRIDGQLVETMKHQKNILPALVARIKIISGLNIAEKRIPQDGRISLKSEGKNYDMRVSVLPTMFGEKIVIRIADKEGFNVTKEQLGLTGDDLEKFDNILSHPHGVVLVTGPTGSGKTTTLYTALKELCKPNVNILTVEDPVECTIRGVNQVQVNVKAGMTFAVALRAFLRQDPDIIMVGEIRDGETAEIATRAAITGHLVLSTLHTNDAASSISRIIDMGVEPFMISSSVVGVIAQRLVRRLCPKCRQEYEPSISEAAVLGLDEGKKSKIYMPKGCPDCNDTGYVGRIAVYEIMTVTREMRELISKGATADMLKDCAIKSGMQTLRDNCAKLVREGITSVDEMMRVTSSQD